MRFGKILPFLRNGKSGQDILLTGIPRSGTTLACRILCDFSQTIALNEPMDRDQFDNPGSAVQKIGEHFSKFRKSLMRSGTAVARTEGGRITDNAYSAESGKRERVVERTSVHFDKPLERDFTLIMKHCAEFSLLLPALADAFSVYAIIRNPLALLSSWAVVDVPVSRGKVAKSARLNPGFHQDLENLGNDLLRRQLFILSWYFGRYNKFSPEKIVRYEELVESPGRVLQPIARGELIRSWKDLENRNANALYDKELSLKLGEALLQTEGEYWRYYSKEDVRILMQEIDKST